MHSTILKKTGLANQIGISPGGVLKSAQFRRIHISMPIIVFAALMLQACSEPPEPEVKDVVRPIKMMILGGGGSGTELEYPGSVSAARSVDLGFEVPGKIIELPI